jgi:hypothetical protein
MNKATGAAGYMAYRLLLVQVMTTTTDQKTELVTDSADSIESAKEAGQAKLGGASIGVEAGRSSGAGIFASEIERGG